MTVSEEAQLHLAKAREFLEAVEGSRDRKLYNAATSDAIISAINSKDAICLALTGRTSKSDNHADAVPELKRAVLRVPICLRHLTGSSSSKRSLNTRLYRSPQPAPTRLWSGRSECSQVPEMSLPAAETHTKARSFDPDQSHHWLAPLSTQSLDLSQRYEQPITAQGGSHRWRCPRRLQRVSSRPPWRQGLVSDRGKPCKRGLWPILVVAQCGRCSV